MSEELAGLRIVSFESRRSSDIARMVEKRGATALQAPSMQEVPLANNAEALDFGEVLMTGQVDGIVLMTGVGTRILIDALCTRWPLETVLEALTSTTLISRGPKPVAALKVHGIKPPLVAPEPNTWMDVLTLLDARWPVSGKTIAVQEYGARNHRFLDGLAERGAATTPVPVYGWQLPDDVGPLQHAISEIVAGRIDCALFTSAHQIRNLFTVAKDMAMDVRLQAAFRDDVVIASVGPVTTEALEDFGLDVQISPVRPKMGHLIKEVALRAQELVHLKKSA